MDVYKTSESEYYLDDGLSGKVNLLKKGDDSVRISNPFYASPNTLQALIKDHQIHGKIVSKEKGDKFMNALKTQTLPLDNVGGRFIGLRIDGDRYHIDYTGIVSKILKKDTGEYLADDFSDLEDLDAGSEGGLKLATEKEPPKYQQQPKYQLSQQQEPQKPSYVRSADDYEKLLSKEKGRLGKFLDWVSSIKLFSKRDKKTKKK